MNTKKSLPEVTAIVPCYNAAATLPRLLGNLLHQTLDDMEIILVDDCSTDDTIRIMHDAQIQFPSKVQIIQNDKNSGPGVSRNRGIEQAHGEYIGFVDADDIVDVTMYEKLYDAAVKEDADIADCAYMKDEKEGPLLQFSKEFCGNLTWGRRSGLISMGGYHATKIFRRSLLMDHDIRFSDAYQLEDMTFLAEAIYFAQRVSGIPELLYIYSQSESSLSHIMKPYTYIQSVAAAMAFLFEKMSPLPHYDKVQEVIEYMETEICKDALFMAQTLDPPTDTQMRQLLLSIHSAIVRIPFAENRYIRAKIPADEIAVFAY